MADVSDITGDFYLLAFQLAADELHNFVNRFRYRSLSVMRHKAAVSDDSLVE